MGRLVDRPKALAGQMGVDLGGSEVRMAEQLLHGTQVGTTFEQVRSVGVPEHMRVQRPPIRQWMALQDAPGIPWRQALSALIEENGIRGALGPRHHSPPVAKPGLEATAAGAPRGRRRTFAP